MALRDNRDILLKAEDVLKAKLKVKEAMAGFLPTLNFTGTRTNTRDYYPKNISQSATQTTLKQYLYKGGKTVNTLRYNEYNEAVRNSILDKTRLDIALNVKKAFYTLLLAKEFARLNQEILQNTQGHLEAMKIRLENGQSS